MNKEVVLLVMYDLSGLFRHNFQKGKILGSGGPRHIGE